MPKRITIKEIAVLANVSKGTVDRVLHNRGEVAQSTREKVLRIAEEGNYATNVFARNLKLNRTYRIAIIIPNDSEYWHLQYKGAEMASNEYESFGVVLKPYLYDRNKPSSFSSKAKKVLAEKPDGIVLAPILKKETIALATECNQLGIPFLFVDSNIEGVGALSFIGQDSFRSGVLSAKLMNYGKIGMPSVFVIVVTAADNLNKIISERINGFKKYYFDNYNNEVDIEEIFIENTGIAFEKIAKKLDVMKGVVHVFIPYSRAHQIAKILQPIKSTKDIRIVGYDLIAENVVYLKNGVIDYLIHQKPELQSYLAIQSFYKHLILKQPIENHQYMPLEIITKENLDYSNNLFA